jgi:AcrR family transcriptional regulator
MPKIVNHRERREAVAVVVTKVVYSQGIGSLTLKKVAEAVGHSATVISHYFSDKREMLLFTHRAAAARTLAKAHEAARASKTKKIKL